MRKVILTIDVIKNAPLELDEDHEVVNPPILLQKKYETSLRNDPNPDVGLFFSFAISEVVEFNDLKSKLSFDVRGYRIESNFSRVEVQVNDGARRYEGKNSVRSFLTIPFLQLDDLHITLDSLQGEDSPSFFSQFQFMFNFSIAED